MQKYYEKYYDFLPIVCLCAAGAFFLAGGAMTMSDNPREIGGGPLCWVASSIALLACVISSRQREGTEKAAEKEKENEQE